MKINISHILEKVNFFSEKIEAIISKLNSNILTVGLTISLSSNRNDLKKNLLLASFSNIKEDIFTSLVLSKTNLKVIETQIIYLVKNNRIDKKNLEILQEISEILNLINLKINKD